jgi:hypothetical protein
VRKDRTSLWLGQAGKAAGNGRTLSAGAEGGSTP